ncbi:hypothetical protein A361_09145 [Cytobacillus oceanisediminis 2691]|uniref:DUF3397 domain-containing protein n=2 Tax=Cytobacillus oceanisediminis TaxID=665099 RepID=A0A160M9E9_9BACI|nr:MULTISPECIES: DUF3397 domain-containing protein [Cytobacillus]AND39282.1 hypothetical protein A361_09145 [Cytobacillus oceanisediminis 2691]MBY0157517.1 DUF3397 domain-containing protein [Cytobacillus firmus]MBU8732842.1 DUF3397 domain-containing protein [Cytobacillus oceanisediminis]MBU8768468.1 DUF3397 domain-containing protein [Cytobacillus oceanisediminis]OHX38668.1 hypothetical protein BBV17_03975 [Cytobacillus oceanisediminis]
MNTVFSSLIATLVTIPLLGYLAVFIISKQITKKHKRSVHIALDVSTLFFILAVHYLIVVIWDKSYLWMIVLSLLITAVTFIIMHWRIKQEINLRALFKGFWRFNFLLYFTAYIVLMLIGLVQRVTSVVFIP